MATYLRFTENIEADMEKGYSFLKTPSMKKATKLKGLCAFSFDVYNDMGKVMSSEEIESKIAQFARNQYYLNTSVAVLIEGDYVGSNPNGEGVLIKAKKVIDTYYL